MVGIFKFLNNLPINRGTSMKYIKFILIFAVAVSVWGCCNCTDKDTSLAGDSTKNPGNNNPTTIQNNKTVALVKIISMNVKSETDYSAKIEVTQIFTDDAYPSIAVEKSQYEVNPNFRLGENKEILDSDVNLELKNFAKKKAGETAKIEFFLIDTKWILHRVLN
jgi:hypothetical protein